MKPQEEMKRKFPGIVDIAYEQYKRDLPRFQVAKDLMSQDVVTVDPEASLDDAARLMGERHIGSLIVVKYRTPVGIITERDLLSKVLALGLFLKDENVEEVMSYPLSGVSYGTRIKEIARLMISKKGRLAVFDAGTLVGIVTASDLIKSLPDVPETEVMVDEFMTRDVTMVDDTTAVSNVAVMMGINRIGSVVVTVKNQPKGIFTERDLLTTFLAKGVSLDVPVGERASPLITAPSGISIHEAAQVMRSKHIKRLPIMKDNALTGIVTARDLVEAYAK